MQALILAAGYGTRLQPYITNYPKPLLEICGKSVITYLIEKIEAIDDIASITVVTNNKFFGQFQAWRKKIKTKKPVVILNDGTNCPGERLGAVGDMALVFGKKASTEDYVVIGGDNFFNDGLEGFIRFAYNESQHASIGLFDIKDKDKASEYGVAVMDDENRIVEFYEKPKNPKSSLVAMCLYYFSHNVLYTVTEYMYSSGYSDAIGNYISWLSKKDRVYGYVFKKDWFDIGDIDVFEKAKRMVGKTGGGNE